MYAPVMGRRMWKKQLKNSHRDLELFPKGRDVPLGTGGDQRGRAGQGRCFTAANGGVLLSLITMPRLLLHRRNNAKAILRCDCVFRGIARDYGTIEIDRQNASPHLKRKNSRKPNRHLSNIPAYY